MAPETMQQTIREHAHQVERPERTPERPIAAPRALDHRCGRCDGLMVEERFIDLLDDTGHLQFTAFRCVQCGEVVDPVILHNRGRSVRPEAALHANRRPRLVPPPEQCLSELPAQP